MKAKILVVDDSPYIHSTVGWLLTHHAYEVQIIPDGLNTLNEIETFRPDLVLLNIFLPHISGIQVCEMVRGEEQYLSLPIIVISGSHAQADIERAIAAGADDYILKPFTDADLMAVIDRHL